MALDNTSDLLEALQECLFEHLKKDGKEFLIVSEMVDVIDNIMGFCVNTSLYFMDQIIKKSAQDLNKDAHSPVKSLGISAETVIDAFLAKVAHAKSVIKSGLK